MPLGTRRATSRSRYVLPVAPPYRLDLTVSVLRRYRTNAVDLLGADGRYRRALSGPADALVVEVAQDSPEALAVTIAGRSSRHEAALALVRRVLGIDVDVGPFLAASRRVAWLAPLARRMRGVHPPRYPTLWEACVNAVVFQQVSLHVASAILKRTIEALTRPVLWDGVMLHAFPSPAAVASADSSLLRAAGLSAGKIATLKRVAEAVISGELDEGALERLPSAEAALRLAAIKGIGPWTAALILLRGFGRLDVFPENDSGAARSLTLATEGKPVAISRVLQVLGSQRGLLYYHLLLARLEARGDLPATP
jgi:DNA-3-methyladenine glycosylase II